MSGWGLALEPAITLALGAPVAFWVGRLSGARWALTRRGTGAGASPVGGARERPLDDRDAICGCNHHLALHAPGTEGRGGASGVCHGTFLLKNVIAKGGRVVDRWQPCPCRRYVGPVPVEELLQARPWSPRLVTGGGGGGNGSDDGGEGA